MELGTGRGVVPCWLLVADTVSGVGVGVMARQGHVFHVALNWRDADGRWTRPYHQLLPLQLVHLVLLFLSLSEVLDTLLLVATTDLVVRST